MQTQRDQYERTLDLVGADKAKAEKEVVRLRAEVEAAIAQVRRGGDFLLQGWNLSSSQVCEKGWHN